MFSPEEPRGFPAPSHSDTSDVAVREWRTIHELIDELSALQRRIGTPLEEPEDLPRVRDLGHELREKLNQFNSVAERAR